MRFFLKNDKHILLNNFSQWLLQPVYYYSLWSVRFTDIDMQAPWKAKLWCVWASRDEENKLNGNTKTTNSEMGVGQLGPPPILMIKCLINYWERWSLVYCVYYCYNINVRYWWCLNTSKAQKQKNLKSFWEANCPPNKDFAWKNSDSYLLKKANSVIRVQYVIHD